MKVSTFIAGVSAAFALGVLQGMWLNAPVFMFLLVISALVIVADLHQGH